MRKVYYLGLLLLLISTASVKAQVTIGKDTIPHGGALLDLRQPDATTKMGVKFPVVSLSDAKQYCLTAGESEAAAGMIVYNDNEDIVNGNGAGLYVWDGSEWNSLNSNVCPSSVQDLEGNRYMASSFGSAGCWMTQNLKSTRNNAMPSGTITLTKSPNPGTTAKIATYPDLNPGNGDSLGLLYTWAAATNRTSLNNEAYDGVVATPRTQGICPSGWHLPSDAEWMDLEKEIAASAAGVYSDLGTTTWSVDYNTNTFPPNYQGAHGQKMKSKTQVTSTPTNGVSKPASAGGFDALFAGQVNATGAVGSFGKSTYYWTSSSHSTNGGGYAWYRLLSSSYAGVLRYYLEKKDMFSVRCKKN